MSRYAQAPIALNPPTVEQYETPRPLTRRGPSAGSIIAWSVFIVFALIICLNHLASKPENVMQQCALAAGNAFWMITFYGFARAVSELCARR